MAIHLLLLWQIVLLLYPIKASGMLCQHICGNVSIDYPFGIGEGCYFDQSFEVICNNSSGSPKPFHKSTNLEISSFGFLDRPQIFVLINSIISVSKFTSTSYEKGVNLTGSPFYFSQSHNRFTAIGCDNYNTTSSLLNERSTNLGGCLSVCTCNPNLPLGSCFDFLCSIPKNLKVFDANTMSIDSRSILQECNSVFMVYQDWLFSNYMQNPKVLKDEEQAVAVLEWGKLSGNCFVEFDSNNKRCNLDNQCVVQLDSDHICLCHSPRSTSSSDKNICSGSLICNTTSGYNCSECPPGYYNMNLYGSGPIRCSSLGGLQGYSPAPRAKLIVIALTSGGLGMLCLIIGAWWLHKNVKRRKKTKLKQKFFKRNGGLLLHSSEGNIEKTKVFTSKELEIATDNFNLNRILGQGGQGTVFKGMLEDGRIVAVKKSKVLDESKVEEFINEVVILSQINHRNVVKLLGCCLETQVPLLVYEFIPNGTLFQYIHDQNWEFPITWDMRLCIAVEVSSALSYLHSAASIPIYHRDIKSTNILLDDKYRAKISDFGTSRSMAVDQTHLTTLVQGTFGYLDPEYFRSSQFTEKSDVYSFGVVLAELLTGEKPIRSIDSEEDRSLVSYFLCATKENRLFEILDARLLKEGNEDELMTVAKIARRCMNLSGKRRPTMKQVATELAGIRSWNGASIVLESLEEIDYIETDFGSFSGSVTFSVDVDPII